MKYRKLKKRYHFCNVCELAKCRTICSAPGYPNLNLSRREAQANHKKASIKRRRHRCDMRKDDTYKWVYTQVVQHGGSLFIVDETNRIMRELDY